jgi:hypothetical protein
MNWILLLAMLVSGGSGGGGAADAGRPTVLVVVGAEGTPEFGRAFEQWADRWAAAAERGGANVVVVGRGEPGGDEAGGDKQRLRGVIEREVKSGTQPLWVVLIGHGTHDGKEAKFNLRGPDVSDAELAEWVAPCRRPLAVVNCASASAPFLNRLAGADRVVITATRSGSEVNFARFGDHLSAAIGDAAGDLDKDGQTSLLEAFLAASHGVEEFYKREGRLATEHALLDDNADGRGTPADWFQGTRATRAAKDGAPVDGAAAHRWHLVLSDAEQAMGADARAARDKLEAEVETLRSKKAGMAEADYYARLEELMVRLARVYEAGPQAAPAEGDETPPASGDARQGDGEEARPAPGEARQAGGAGDSSPAKKRSESSR